MSRELIDTTVVDCFEVRPPRHRDLRGTLTKPFMALELDSRGLSFDLRELIWSESTEGVIRGLHFQVPPMEGAKFVYCVSGHVRDIVVDLRVGSPSFGQYAAVDLQAEIGNAIYVPSGCAHGFEVRSEHAVVTYAIDVDYDPATDGGIRWDSAGVEWRTPSPILSDKDQSLQALADFESPFRYGQGA